VLDYATVAPSLGNDLPYVLLLPSYTAAARFHGRLAPELMARDLSGLLAEAEAFARALPPEAKTVLVVTSPSHSRRAKLALAHVLPGRELVMCPTPHERFEREWWTHQGSAKAVVLELAKFAQYYLRQPFRTRQPEEQSGNQTENQTENGAGNQTSNQTSI